MHKRFLVALLAVVIAGVMMPAAASAQAPAYITQWGGPDGMLHRLAGVAVDASGNVYVAEELNFLIRKFTGSGVQLTQWGTYRSFGSLAGVAVDGNGNVYVADESNHRIQEFTSSGTYLTQWGSCGSGNGQFEYPRDVAVDASGNVYVADVGNNRIQVFTSDGTYLTQWGTEGREDRRPGVGMGKGDGQFNGPLGVAVDRSGDVYVADAGNKRIQVFGSLPGPGVVPPARRSGVPRRR